MKTSAQGEEMMFGAEAETLGFGTKQNVHLIYLAGLKKLLSKAHARDVTKRLDDAIADYHAAKRADSPMRVWWALYNIDALCDALNWLEAARDGTLEEHLREAQQGRERTIFTAGITSTSHYLTGGKKQSRGRSGRTK